MILRSNSITGNILSMKKAKTAKMTLKELADQAGGSTMTACRAIHGHTDVSARTRRKILTLAMKHHYTIPAAPGAKLSKRMNMVCSFVNLEADDPPGKTGYHWRLLAGLQQGAADCGATLLNLPFDPGGWPPPVNRRQVDGLVLIHGNEFVPFPLPLPKSMPSTVSDAITTVRVVA